MGIDNVCSVHLCGMANWKNDWSSGNIVVEMADEKSVKKDLKMRNDINGGTGMR